MRLYLAGPMTGIPKFNFPRFIEVATKLRAAGHTIVSPNELDSEAVREAAMASPDGSMSGGMVAGETWGQILARDVRIVADQCDGVVLLEGWEHSRGACLESYVNMLCNRPVYLYEDTHAALMRRVSHEYVKSRML